MGNFLAKTAIWKLFNKKEIKDDWATENNWVCKNQ
jgi:hypothetical protein